MLYAKHHFFIYPFFQWYAKFLLRRKFQTVLINGDFIDKRKPVLLIANHVSWWDGFWAMYLNLKMLKRKFHFMMQEDQLLRYRFFNYTGAFSVNRGSREVLESISYAAEILNHNENMLLMYPQGSLQSIYKSDFVFEKRIERILTNKTNEIQIMFSVNLIDYLAYRKPTLNIYIKEYKGECSRKAIQQAYNEFYAACLSTQIANAL